MIDATKLPRPGGARASNGQGGADIQSPATAAVKTGAAAASADQVASYPAKNLVLAGGRYYTTDTKK